MSHTRTPWRWEPGSKTIRSIPANYWLATMDSWDGQVDNQANAEFIVRAVNSHEALVSALTHLLAVAEDGATIENQIAQQEGYKALAMAKGGAQ